MARRDNSKLTKWGIIGGAIAGGVAMIPIIPALKRRAMRPTTILKKDHRMVSGLMMTLQMTPRINGMVRRRLFDQIRYSLMAHTQAEEEILYPAMRDFMPMIGQSKVDESYRQNHRIKDLLNDLTAIDPTSDAFDAKLVELKNAIRHHVQEEEEEMFPLLMQRMSLDEQEALGRRIHDRKMDLMIRSVA